MPRRSGVTYSLVRKRIRPSFNKTNIYNAATWNKNANRNTQFRQVFFAKQETRSYHGEHLTETQLRNVFKPENASVSPLQSRKNDQGEVPYAMQTFTALERRLDFAVFRSLFAASVRQAAQFIVGGAVKVNGVRISSPSYALQAGDVFSVDPNRVLEALGRSKPSAQQSIELTNKIIRRYNKYLEKCRANPEKMWARKEGLRYRHQVYNDKFTSKAVARADAHNSKLKQQMNQKFMELQPQRVLAGVLSGDLPATNEAITAKAAKVAGFVKSEQFSISTKAAEPTHAEEHVDAEQSPVDPLPEHQKASQQNGATSSEEVVDADQSPEDPLPEYKKAEGQKEATASEEHVDAEQSSEDPLPDSEKASRVNIKSKGAVDPTLAQEDVDADNSPTDPLPETKKASQQNEATPSQQDVDADNSPVDPLPEAKKASQQDEATRSQEDVDADNSSVDPLPESKKASQQNEATPSEEDVDADNSPVDPLPESKKASQQNEATPSEEDVDADNSPVDPLPDSEKASHVNAAYSRTDAAAIAAKYQESKPRTYRDVMRAVDEIIKETRQVIREQYTSQLVDAKAAASFDPTWVERLPQAIQEVAADLPKEELANLKIALPWSTSGKLYGLSDPSKRWFTPWTPRQFMAPMAVLPHHIEVDFETCHAVYLRDPVARPNHSEVISPFSLEMHERAHMWYIARRRKNLSRL